jgi:hypothetical protein
MVELESLGTKARGVRHGAGRMRWPVAMVTSRNVAGGPAGLSSRRTCAYQARGDAHASALFNSSGMRTLKIGLRCVGAAA